MTCGPSAAYATARATAAATASTVPAPAPRRPRQPGQRPVGASNRTARPHNGQAPHQGSPSGTAK